jgi:hypothetical protein
MGNKFNKTPYYNPAVQRTNPSQTQFSGGPGGQTSTSSEDSEVITLTNLNEASIREDLVGTEVHIQLDTVPMAVWGRLGIPIGSFTKSDHQRLIGRIAPTAIVVEAKTVPELGCKICVQKI